MNRISSTYGTSDFSDEHSSINAGIFSNFGTSTSILGKKDYGGNITVPLVIVAVITSLGGLLIGYNSVTISIVILKNSPSIKNLIVVSSIFSSVFGSMISVFFNEWQGRRRSILISSIFFLVGDFLMSITSNVGVIITGLVMSSIAIGISSMTVPIYISECAPAAVRGRLVAMFGIVILVGRFIAHTITYKRPYEADNWIYLLCLGILPAIIHFLGIYFLPESPRILIYWGKINDAISSLDWLRGRASDFEANDIISVVQSNEDKSHVTQYKMLQLIFCFTSTRKMLIFGGVLHLFYQVMGITAFMYFSTSPNMPHPSEWEAILVCGVAMCIWILLTIDRLGRQFLLISLTLVNVISLLTLSLAFYTDIDWMVSLSQVAHLIFIQVGIGPLSWIITSEIYPLWARSMAMGIITSLNFVFYLISILVFPIIVSPERYGRIFLIYFGISILFMLFFFL